MTITLSPCRCTGLKIHSKNHWLHSLCNGRHTFPGIHPKRGYEALEAFGLLENFAGRLHMGTARSVSAICGVYMRDSEKRGLQARRLKKLTIDH